MFNIENKCIYWKNEDDSFPEHNTIVDFIDKFKPSQDTENKGICIDNPSTYIGCNLRI